MTASVTAVTENLESRAEAREEDRRKFWAHTEGRCVTVWKGCCAPGQSWNTNEETASKISRHKDGRISLGLNRNDRSLSYTIGEWNLMTKSLFGSLGHIATKKDSNPDQKAAACLLLEFTVGDSLEKAARVYGLVRDFDIFKRRRAEQDKDSRKEEEDIAGIAMSSIPAIVKHLVQEFTLTEEDYPMLCGETAISERVFVFCTALGAEAYVSECLPEGTLVIGRDDGEGEGEGKEAQALAEAEAEADEEVARLTKRGSLRPRTFSPYILQPHGGGVTWRFGIASLESVVEEGPEIA